MSLLGGIGAHLSKRFTNAVTGVTFNQDAFDEAHAQPLKLSELSEDSTPEYVTEEEWSNLTKDGPRAHDQVDLLDEFEVTESPTVAIKHLGIKITQAAIEKAAEAADVGHEYAKFALKYIAAEARRPTPVSSTDAGYARAPAPIDIGWITKPKTMIDVISTVKQRFPSLKDIETAYKSGRQASKEERHAAHAPIPLHKLRDTEAPPPKSSLQPPRSRTTSMNEQSPFTDPPHRKGKRADSTNQHDTFEDVPLNDSSDDEYDADIEIDEQEDELYAKTSAGRYLNKVIVSGKAEEDTMDTNDIDDQDERELEAEQEAAEEESRVGQKRLYQPSEIKEDFQKYSNGQKGASKGSESGAKGYYSEYVAQRWK